MSQAPLKLRQYPRFRVRVLSLSTILFFATLVLATTGYAQPVVIDRIEDAKANPDFLVQGEYAGENKAMQVIARGDGEFDIVVFEGGLPGAGWNGTETRQLDGDADLIVDLAESMGLKRVERKSPTLGATPPAGAIVLFDGTPASVEKHWQGGKLSPDGLLVQGTQSKDTFRDYQLHLEFRTPFMPSANGQARGNSGVYHQGRYETQILDSFGLKGLNNETGGIYEVSDPSLNMCFPPLSWQTYDVQFTAARYDADGKETAPARITARVNGVLVQSDVAVAKPTRAAPMKAGPEPGPIYLQDHGNPIRFQNIWILPRDAEKDARRPIVPAYERFFAQDASKQARGGELLISSLACDACHASHGNASLPIQRGPDLSAIAGRVRPNAIVDMIAHPHATQSGTVMPDPWSHLSDDQRAANAEAITSFLLTHSAGKLSDRTVPQSAADRGKDLYHSIGCVACHGSQEGAPTPASTTIQFGNLSQKYTLPSLSKFLLEPHLVRSGGRMPRLTQDSSEASQIAAYLLRDVVVKATRGKFTRRVYRGSWENLPDFANLEVKSISEVEGLKIDDIQPGSNYGVTFTANIRVDRPGQVAFRLTSDDGASLRIGDKDISNDGIHPATTKNGRVKLDEGVHEIVVSYFQGGGEAVLDLEVKDPDLGWLDIGELVEDPGRDQELNLVPNQFQAEANLVEKGKQLFVTTGCVNCHRFEPVDEREPQLANIAGKPLKELDATKGCLADDVQSPAVDYELTATQRESVRAALKLRSESRDLTVDDAGHIELTMASLNCFACHARDGVGGVEVDRDAWFQTTTPEMGIEGRLPPPLDGVGDKLNDAYLVKLSNEGASERPYMKTRMPAFGHEHLAKWHEAVKKLDRRDEMPTVALDDTEINVIGAGRVCVGNSGLACIKCHRFGDETGGGIGAIDMLKMTERLRPEWFYRYLLDPQKYRPGTRMPSSFLEGKSALTSVYDGDPGKQVDAMWRYLSQGSDAKPPVGLVAGAIVLSPDARPRIYRNFITGSSPRGIAVGYPGDINLVWDADQMTIVQIWKNGFIDASKHWINRGQGSQQPLGDAIVELPSSPSVSALKSINEAWPEQSLRDRGAKFRGYVLDYAGMPTFKYETDDYLIEDKPIVVTEEGRVGLRRTIIVTPMSPATAATLVWSAARGKIKSTGEGSYRINDLYDVKIIGVQVEQVSVAGEDELRVLLPTGKRIELLQEITW